MYAHNNKLFYSFLIQSGPIRSHTQITYFRKYLDALILEISPTELNDKTQSMSSLSSIAELAPPPAPLLPRRSGSQSGKSSSSRETSPEYRLQLSVPEEDEITSLWVSRSRISLPRFVGPSFRSTQSPQLFISPCFHIIAHIDRFWMFVL